MSKILTDAKFGFEFTFCTTSTNPSGNWTESIIEGKTIASGISECYEKFAESFSKALGIEKDHYNNEYRLSLPVYKLQFDDDFWITTSVDPKVIELQTKPVTKSEIEGDYKTHFEDLFSFFLNSRAYGIGNGGGHINVDYESGFNGDFDLIKKTLLAAETIIEEKINNDQLEKEYKDLIDLPYLSHDAFLSHFRLDHKKSKRNLISDWERNVYPTSITNFKEKHTLWLLAHPTTNQEEALKGKSDAIRKERAIHYQAINVEHIFEEEEERKRLEFRFFKAQTSVDDILKGIELIDRIVKHAESI